MMTNDRVDTLRLELNDVKNEVAKLSIFVDHLQKLQLNSSPVQQPGKLRRDRSTPTLQHFASDASVDETIKNLPDEAYFDTTIVIENYDLLAFRAHTVVWLDSDGEYRQMSVMARGPAQAIEVVEHWLNAGQAEGESIEEVITVILT